MLIPPTCGRCTQDCFYRLPLLLELEYQTTCVGNRDELVIMGRSVVGKITGFSLAEHPGSAAIVLLRTRNRYVFVFENNRTPRTYIYHTHVLRSFYRAYINVWFGSRTYVRPN